MQAATFAAKIFLQSANWRDQIRAVLEQLGKATGSSHVFIFENHSLPDGKRGTSQRYEWAAPGVPSDLDNPLYQNMPVYDVRTRRWYAAMTAGEAFYGNIETLNSEEREIYIRRGLLTFIDVPILVSGEWWGIIGFDDYLRVRNWTQVEVEAIKIAASTLGSAIERQMSDAALRESESRHRTELEQRVQERTQQLQDALQEIESVSYTASHDLRAPLRAVDGYSSILLQEYGDSLNPQQFEYLTRIKQASRRMGNLLDDLIQLIRYSRQPMKIEIVNLSELTTQVKNELHNRYPDRVVRVEIQTGLAATGDKSLLGVLLLELLDNAWKFTGTTPDPIIKFGIQEQDGERVFFVRDNGIGIDMTYASRLFRTFEQLYAPGEIEGTGMGLATVQRIIQRHHGRVWVEGKLNEGATFYFTLPE
jgi:signal transduction histidine kinase